MVVLGLVVGHPGQGSGLLVSSTWLCLHRCPPGFPTPPLIQLAGTPGTHPVILPQHAKNKWHIDISAFTIQPRGQTRTNDIQKSSECTGYCGTLIASSCGVVLQGPDLAAGVPRRVTHVSQPYHPRTQFCQSPPSFPSTSGQNPRMG